MKELEPKDKDQVIELRQAPESYSLTKIGSIQLKRGHTLYMINKDTLHIKEAQYKQDAVRYKDAVNGNITTSKKVIEEEGYFYIAALNKKNAFRKFLKMINYKFQ